MNFSSYDPDLDLDVHLCLLACKVSKLEFSMNYRLDYFVG